MFRSCIILILVCFSFSTNIDSLTLPSDISALKSFKSTINPKTIPSSSCIASWDFSVDPCSLPRRTHFVCGITCNPDSTRVTALVLDPAGYSAIISPAIFQLTQLAHLDLSDNSFHGSLSDSLGSLINLETLTLRFNSLTGSLPDSLSKLSSLVSLDISHNALTGSLPPTVASLTNLRTMDLSFNKLTGAIPKLPLNLAELALKSNYLSGSLYQTSFQQLSKLEVVELSDNMLTGVLKDWFFLLPALQQVDLANNSFTGVEILKLKNKYNELVAVDLGFNKFNGYLPVNFAVFPILASLSLRYNRFKGQIPWQYGNMSSIKRLFLDGNFLNGKVPSGLLSNDGAISGSLGDNCLDSCPASSRLCLPLQKPSKTCKEAYGTRPKP
ncbi:hypothetical protein GIB67_023473 [Kingdonia uniflora]|uniref:Uncharacterized protein n=1 Tax=Kingdonia uniflora TaxID=39325 RepID=A0A7J7PA74_9MAGN|nr:hypothetical protein GIB67_023473 [Kingdonia uniflora]